jgi:RES domain-containing protein
MTVIRLCTRKHQELDGIGASQTGGRWNSQGNPVIYTASCTALAVLEGLVHMKTLPKNLLLLRIEIPGTIRIEAVPQPVTEIKLSQQLGDEWLNANESPVLSVPSVIAPLQRNYLLNPAHNLFTAIQITDRYPFVMDSRLVGHLSEMLVEETKLGKT